MKKLLTAALAFAVALGASAQIKSVDIAGNLRSDFGLGIGITMPVTSKIDFAPRFNYYFPEHGTAFNIDGNFQYNFNVAPEWTIYPIAGLAYYHAEDYNKLGVNLGVGARYNLKKNLGIFAEGKYQWVDGADDSYLTIGVNIGI